MNAIATQSAPRERPILFSAPMVRAILDGRKTQTRRIVRGNRGAVDLVHRHSVDERYWGEPGGWIKPPCASGDRLWVKETWHRDQSGGVWGYYADYDPSRDGFATNVGGRKVPSLFMPRWASRILLEVISVRVERVQEITEEDAIAEGMPDTRGVWEDVPGTRGGPIESFRSLWNSLHAKHPERQWAANPFVWRIEFRRIEP